MSGTTRGQLLACRRAGALVRGLRSDLERQLGEGAPPAAASLRGTLRQIDDTLAVGLGFDCGGEPEFAYRRGHARNVALVLRRTIEGFLATGGDAARRADLLSQALRFADELVGTVAWIRQRAAELDVPRALEPWTATWAGRLLALTARLLPPELRREFIEDQCGNLASVESGREWVAYLLGLLTRMPRIAAAASAGRSRW